MSSSNRPRFALNTGLAAGCLGLTPLLKKSALSGGASPLPVVLTATAIGAGLACLYVLLRDGAATLRQLHAATVLRIAVVGVTGSGAVVLLSILAMTQTSATNRSLFQSMYPVATALCARWILGERLSGVSYLIIVVMCVGLFLMNTGPGGVELGPPFWMLAATLPLIGLADVYAKRSLADTDARLVAAARLLFGSLFLVLTLPWMHTAQWQALPPHAPFVLAAGVTTAGGVLFLYRAMDTTEASFAAAFIALAPVVTGSLEWALLGESFSSLQLLGLGLVVGGAVSLAGRV